MLHFYLHIFLAIKKPLEILIGFGLAGPKKDQLEHQAKLIAEQIISNSSPEFTSIGLFRYGDSPATEIIKSTSKLKNIISGLKFKKLVSDGNEMQSVFDFITNAFKVDTVVSAFHRKVVFITDQTPDFSTKILLENLFRYGISVSVIGIGNDVDLSILLTINDNSVKVQSEDSGDIKKIDIAYSCKFCIEFIRSL